MLNSGRSDGMRTRDTWPAGLRHALGVIFLCLFASSPACLYGAPACNAGLGSYPHRIISLGPTITEKLYILGAEADTVGVTTYCRRPQRATLKEKIGNVTHPSLEKIIRLKPDLVLATALTDARLIKTLRRIGTRTEILHEPKSFKELNEQFIGLGRMLGREREALEIVARAGEQARRISNRVAKEEKTKVFCQIGAHPLFAAVGDTLLDDFIEQASGTNIAKTAKIGFYNREEVIRQDPDVIIIVTMGIAAESERMAWRRFKSIKAVRNGRVFIMDAYRTCSPTPLTFADALAEIAGLLHPESGIDAKKSDRGASTERLAGKS